MAADFAILCEPSNAQIEGGCQGTLRAEVTLTGVAAHSARAWMGHNAIRDAGAVLQRLADYEPAAVEVDGLTYREGLNAVRIGGGIAGGVIPTGAWSRSTTGSPRTRRPRQAEAHMRAVLDGFAVEVTDVAAGARPGLDRPAADFLAAMGGQASAKFGWTDVARFAALGIPAVNFGPGDPSKAHADDEFCPADDLHTCRDGLVRWLS